jgi:hypothetical protein
MYDRLTRYIDQPPDMKADDKAQSIADFKIKTFEKIRKARLMPGVSHTGTCLIFNHFFPTSLSKIQFP